MKTIAPSSYYESTIAHASIDHADHYKFSGRWRGQTGLHDDQCSAVMPHAHRAHASDGTEIAWSSTGPPAANLDATPVVLVHGITECAAMFDPLVERLASSHEVITLDLRGHGESGRSDRYDLAAMADDVAAVCAASEVTNPHLVGHSLGGAMVSAAGSAMAVASVVDIDQSLQLGSFKDLLDSVADELRDPDAFPLVIEAMFAAMNGDLLSTSEVERVASLQRADQDVVLGVWDLILSSDVPDIKAAVDAALARYAGRQVPYLGLFGIDPGPDYAAWLGTRITGSTVETWAEHGHYPHLVDPDRFVARLESFWTTTV